MAYSKLAGADRATVAVQSAVNSAIEAGTGAIADAKSLVQQPSWSVSAARGDVPTMLPPANVNSTDATVSKNAPQASSSVSSNKSKHKPHCSNAKPNPLEAYASMTCLFTMGCLSNAEYNGASYRGGTINEVIFSSAGRFDGKRVSTAHGKPEYYVENFKQQNVIAPNKKIGNAYAFKYEFEIFEPYSMGVFLQTITKAAYNKGHNTHIEAPYVIKLEFQGWDDNGNSMPGLIEPKYFVIRITNMEFTASESGSKYQIEAIPYNHIGYSDNISILKSDIAILINDGTKDVQHALVDGEDSLVNALNTIEADQRDTGRADDPVITYKIEFPVPNGAGDSEGNEISKAKFKYDLTDGGRIEFQHAENVVDGGDYVEPGTGLIAEDAKRKIHYAQGQSILTVITEIIKASEWTKKQVVDNKNSNGGFITYFKIDVQETIDDPETRQQTVKKTITYKIRPYTVHGTMYQNTPSIVPGLTPIEELIAKEYQYMFTGQNVDVLEFDIKINYLFFQGINPQSPNKNQSFANIGGAGVAQQDPSKTEFKDGGNVKALRSKDGLLHSPAETDNSQLKVQHNGLDSQSVENQIADNFHRAFVEATSADMIKLNMKILGDPYWLADSGPGNYTITVPGPAQSTADDAMNYESSDIFVYVVFRVPDDVDVNQGKYIFPEKNAYGGIYRVTEVENQFSDGTFFQTLQAVRMVGQSLDYSDAQPGSGGSEVEFIKGTQPQRNSNTVKII